MKNYTCYETQLLEKRWSYHLNLLIQNTNAILKITSKTKAFLFLTFSLLSSPFLFSQTTLTTRAAGNWNSNDTWISGTLTGTITTSTTTNRATVLGVGTNFTGQLSVGAALYRNDGTTLIGTIATITNDTSLTLSGNAANANSTINFRTRKIPGALDTVIIFKDNVTVTIPSNLAAACAVLEIGTNGTSSSEIMAFSDATSSLSVSGNVTVFGPTTGNTREITLNAGTMMMGGDLQLGTGQTGNNSNRKSRLTITTGTMTVSGNLTFNNISGSDPAQTQIIMSGGAGTFNLGGAFTISNGSGTLSPGTSSTFNFNDSAAQTIPIGVSSVVYNNINVNNVSGTTLSAAITAANVTGNINIQTGTLNNGGFAIVGNSGDAFSISNDAVLNLSGTSAFPTGFGTTTLGSTSTVNYNGNNQNVATKSYGNLELSTSGNKTFAGATAILGNLTLNGTAIALLPNGTTSTAASLNFNGTYQVLNSWGGTGSSAINKNSLKFGTATTGIVNNGNSCSTAAIAGAATVCPGTNATTLTLSGNIGGIQWQTSTDDITFSNIVGATSTTHTPTNINSTTYFRTVATNGVCKTASSPSVSVAVRSTTYNGATWSNGNPAANATIAYNLSGNHTLNSDISACSCTILSGNITVPSGKSMKLIDKLTVSGGSITFENNANLIQTNSVANSGVITVKRNSALQVRLDHTLWSSPVENVNLFGFSPSTLTNRFYTYATATNTYINSGLSASSTFIPGKGFAVRAPNTFPTVPQTWEGVFTGIPNNGNIPFTLDTSGTGYNLVGNPYPSTIDAVSFISGNPNIGGSLYFYAHTLTMGTNGLFPAGTNYAVWNASGSTVATSGTSGVPSLTPNGIIQVGQGFIVKAIGSGTVNFNNGMRTNNTLNQFYRNATTLERHRLWLNLSNTSGIDYNQIMVGYIEGATMGFDTNFDALAFGNSGNSLSSKIDGLDYTIQGRALAFSDSDRVLLGFKAESAGNYTITLTDKDGLFLANQPVYILDTTTNSTHEIKTAPYIFYSEAGTFDNRFQLVYTTALGIPMSGFNSNSVKAYKKEGVYTILSEQTPIKEVIAYDTLGRLIFKQSNINAQSVTLTGLASTNQIAFLKIISQENTSVSIKIIN
jgi:hypothetical protein